jgi:Male sterility protein
MRVFFYFTTTDLNFVSTNLIKLSEELDEDDKKIFRFDHRFCNWDQFTDLMLEGIRRFLLKEGPETIPKAQKKLRRLRTANIGLQVMICFVVFNLVFLMFTRIF